MDISTTFLGVAAGLCAGIALSQRDQLESERRNAQKWERVAAFWMKMPQPPPEGEPVVTAVIESSRPQGLSGLVKATEKAA